MLSVLGLSLWQLWQLMQEWWWQVWGWLSMAFSFVWFWFIWGWWTLVLWLFCFYLLQFLVNMLILRIYSFLFVLICIFILIPIAVCFNFHLLPLNPMNPPNQVPPPCQKPPNILQISFNPMKNPQIVHIRFLLISLPNMINTNINLFWIFVTV